jgi:large subunit ribosomal protein L6
VVSAFRPGIKEITVSRIGKQPIKIPDGVKVNLEGNLLVAKGAKGQVLQVPFSEKMKVSIEGGVIEVKPGVEEKKIGALWGLTRALLSNAVEGVHKEWEKVLELRGIGYRAQVKGKDLDLQVGQSHPIVITPPAGISFVTTQETIEGQNVNIITVRGIDKKLVGDVSARIRDLRPPEPYKGKGIRYRGEYVRRKAGKATG